MPDVAHRDDGCAGGQHFTHVGGFHQHHAIHRRYRQRVGKLRVHLREICLGPFDFGAPRGQLLFPALQLEPVGLRHFERAARVFHLRRGAVHLLDPGSGEYQRRALVGLLQRRVGALPVVAEFVVLGSGDVVVLEQRLRAVPIFLGAIELGLRRIDGSLGFLNLLRTRAVLQLRQAGFGGGEVGAPLLDVSRQRLAFPGERSCRLRQLVLRGGQAGGAAVALRRQLVAVQARDQLPLLHQVALIHRALDEPPGGLEADIDFGELDVAGDDDPAARIPPRSVKRINRYSGRNQHHRQRYQYLFHGMLLRILPMACARSMRATL